MAGNTAEQYANPAWGRLTQQAQCVVIAAHKIAAHEFSGANNAHETAAPYLATEHLLLALLDTPRFFRAAQILTAQGCDPNALRAELRRRMISGSLAGAAVGRESREGKTQTDSSGATGEVAWTPRAARVLRLAAQEAATMRNARIGTEHLLLGLVRERDGLAGRVLARAGMTPENVHAVLPPDDSARSDTAHDETPPTPRLTGVRRARYDARKLDALPPLPALPVLPRPAGYPAFSNSFAASGAGTGTDAPTTDNEIRALIAELTHDGRSSRPRFAAFWRVGLIVALVLIGYIVVGLNAEYGPETAIMALCVALTILRLFDNQVASPRQEQAALRLARSRDRRLAGQLVEFRAWQDGDVRRAAEDALIVLLPTLRPEDGDWFTTGQRRNLYAALAPVEARRNPALAVVVLQAMAQIGDAQALPWVEELAAGSQASKVCSPEVNAALDRVHAAACDCLPLLRARVTQQEARRTHLRPSSAPERTADELLRAADPSVASAAPETLLRAAPSPDKIGPEAPPRVVQSGETPRHQTKVGNKPAGATQ